MSKGCRKKIDSGLERLNKLANDIALEKVLRTLVYYRSREGVQLEYKSFENFCESVLIGAYGQAEFERICSHVEKKLKKEN